MRRRTVGQKLSLENNLSKVQELEKSNSIDEAVKLLEKIIPENPSEAKVFFKLAHLYFRKMDLERASAYFLKALQLDPKNDEIKLNLVTINRIQGNYKPAIAILEKMMQSSLKKLNVILALAVLYEKVKDYEKLEAHLKIGLENFPDEPSLLYLLSRMYFLEHKYEEASKAAEIASKELISRAADAVESPRFDNAVEVFALLVMVLKISGKKEKLEEAITYFLNLPYKDETDILAAIVNIFLDYGFYEEGFQYYKWRKLPEVKQQLSIEDQAAPLDANLDGIHLNLVGEQGIGDELFFLRYLPLLDQRKASYTLFLTKKIVSMVQRNYPQVAVFPRDEAMNKRADKNLLLGDLPLALSCYRQVDYEGFTPDQAYLEKMKELMKSFGPPPYIGFTWEAGLKERGRKSIPLELYIKHFKSFKGTLVLLQRMVEQEDMRLIHREYKGHLMDANMLSENIEMTLAIMHLLDDYVTVSNTNIYLRPKNSKMKVVKINYNDWRLSNNKYFPGAKIYSLDYDRNRLVVANQIFEDLLKDFREAF
ncbi:MAG: tetratricopeptide repeat protein [Chlamydiales bacterium]|nr:tetratricopeptide repeat protein [Chlamydiales bacterium]